MGLHSEMPNIFPSVLALHITAGLVAVMVGVLPILTRKDGQWHRRSGRAFAGLMSALLICAWVMTALRFNTYFAALTATATITVFSGVRVLGRKRPDLNVSQRARPVDWAVALAAVGIGVWILGLVLAGRIDRNIAVSAALAYGALTYGGWDLWRFARPTDWPFSPNLWNYEHLLKMLSAYGAVLSAFSGNFLTFLPTPWSQLWPTFLFQPLAILWIVILAAHRRRGFVTA